MEIQLSNSIVIDIAKNGFVVTLPNRNIPTEEYHNYLIKCEAQKQRIFNNETEVDSDLLAIQGTEELKPVPISRRFKKLSIEEISDDNTFVFRTLMEALKFIEEEFKTKS